MKRRKISGIILIVMLITNYLITLNKPDVSECHYSKEIDGVILTTIECIEGGTDGLYVYRSKYIKLFGVYIRFYRYKKDIELEIKGSSRGNGNYINPSSAKE